MTQIARFLRQPDQVRETRTIRLGSGSTIEILAGPAETNGTVSIYRWRMSASSQGPAPHLHSTFSETFILEEGAVDYFDGQAWRTLLPGHAAHAATGAVHALQKERPEPATLLMVLSPGVPREEYFAQLASSNEQDLGRRHEVHDNHFVAEHNR